MRDNLSVDEERELRDLNVRLRGRGFDLTIRDPLYELFMKAWADREDPTWREVVQLTPEQRQARSKLAAEIVEQLRQEHGRE
jgi:hypothetical protein